MGQLDPGSISKPRAEAAPRVLTNLPKAVNEGSVWEAAIGGAADQPSTQLASEPRDWAMRIRKPAVDAIQCWDGGASANPMAALAGDIANAGFGLPQLAQEGFQ